MSKVNITKRIKLVDRGWYFCKVVIAANGKIKPDWAIVDGKEEHHPEAGRYYLDFLENGRRRRIAAGATAVEAQTAANQQERLMQAHKAATAAGITLPEKEPVGGRSLREAVDTYLLEIQAHKKKKTFSAYRTALTYFLESCRKQTLEQITRTDLLSFKTYLRDKKKQSDRSIWNKFENVMSFLKQQKITGLLTKNDRPVFTEEEVSTYTRDELDKFFAVCTETETLWFQFFNFTAMREQEVMHVSWSDIDFERSVVTVRENKRFGWKPKAYKGRFIPIPSSLLTMLKIWKSKSDASCGLVFPTTGCKPKQNFLDECKAIAERAKLTGEFYLHKFRATRATLWLQAGIDIKSVQQMLGHTDMESTLRYLGAQRVDLLQAQIEKMKGMGV
jgi:integrase/recombinase XerD